MLSSLAVGLFGFSRREFYVRFEYPTVTELTFGRGCLKLSQGLFIENFFLILMLTLVARAIMSPLSSFITASSSLYSRFHASRKLSCFPPGAKSKCSSCSFISFDILGYNSLRYSRTYIWFRGCLDCKTSLR